MRIPLRFIAAWPCLALFQAALVAGPVPAGKPASYPDWWFTRDVIGRLPAQTNNTNPAWPDHYPPADDYAAANIGQLKYIATAAATEFQATLPAVVSSPSITALLTAWQAAPAPGVIRDDFATVNLGQLKFVAAPFHWQQMELGLSDSLPWSATVADDDSFALANLGQLKQLFSFEIPELIYTDSDPTEDPAPFDPPPPPAPPPPRVEPYAPALGIQSRAGDTVTLNWWFSAITSDNQPVTTLRLYRNGQLIASPAAEASATFEENGSALHGAFTYVLRCEDALGRLSAPSQPLVVAFNPLVHVTTGYSFGGWWGWNWNYGWGVSETEQYTQFQIDYRSLSSTRWKHGFESLLPTPPGEPRPVYKTRNYSTTYQFSDHVAWSGRNDSWGYSYSGSRSETNSQNYTHIRSYSPALHRWSDEYSGNDSQSTSYSSVTKWDNGSTDSSDSTYDARGTWSLAPYENSTSEGTARFTGTASGSSSSGGPWGPSSYQASVVDYADTWDPLTETRRHGTHQENHTYTQEEDGQTGSRSTESSVTETLSEPYTTTELRERAAADLTTLGAFPSEWSRGKSSSDGVAGTTEHGSAYSAGYSLSSDERLASLTRLAYRVSTSNSEGRSATFRFRWREVFYPQVRPPLQPESPQILAERSAEVTSSDAQPATEEFVIEPPESPGEIRVECFNPTLRIARILPAAPPPPDPAAPVVQPGPVLPHVIALGDRLVPEQNLRPVYLHLGTNAYFDTDGDDRISSVTLAATSGASSIQLLGIRYGAEWSQNTGELSASDLWLIQPAENLVDAMFKPDAPRRDFQLFAVGLDAGSSTTQLALSGPGSASGTSPATALTTTVAPALLVDINRDGEIDTADATLLAAGRIPRFWVNDDDNDHRPDKETDSSGDFPGSSSPDSEHPGVDGMRDLIDLLPVELKLGSALESLSAAERAQIRLTLRGNAFNLVEPIDPKGAESPLLLNPAGAGNPARPKHLIDELIAKRVLKAATRSLDGTGYLLPTAFVEQVIAGNSVVLVEGRSSYGHGSGVEQTLELHAEGPGMAPTVLATLRIRLSGVEQMYERKSLFDGEHELPAEPATNAPECYSTDPAIKNRRLISIHGYNVNKERQTRIWHSNMFRRLFWSGLQVPVHAVIWHGAEHQQAGSVTPDFHTNVLNAFKAAQRLSNYVNALPGGASSSRSVIAHSLGNLVVASAINDYQMQVDRYVILNGALAAESMMEDAPILPSMAHSDWLDANHLPAFGERTAQGADTGDFAHSAARWHLRWPEGDYRRTLTWRNRFPNLPWSGMYNLYSSADEVFTPDWEEGQPFQETPGAWGVTFDKTINAINAEIASLTGLYTVSPDGFGAWTYQEKLKGRLLPVPYVGDGFIGSSYGGWGMTASTPWAIKSGPTTNSPHGTKSQFMRPPTAAQFPTTLRRISALPAYDNAAEFLSLNQRHPFFRQVTDNGKNLAGSPEANGVTASYGDLFGPNGSEVARQHRSQLLASAIPALTHALGHEPLDRPANPIGGNINLNLNTSTGGRRPDNDWPKARSHLEQKYRTAFMHSDVRDIPYFYNYPAYDRITEAASPR